ncbi:MULTISPECIES: HAD family hydrolase [Microbulbifer]|uniref:HAD family hydrolase n=1 Tax=Microbulbifer celer TaxID=435905 RepID=A0ABW3UCB4_9GAMM|nr:MULTISPECIES: HAD family hydrolase [Microbulbifer]UFN55813.1 haloacid dehalogenase-like hydrolase [Microbulbifer celer]
MKRLLPIFAIHLLLLLATGAAAQSDPLPSWNDSASKRAIVDFVGSVTKEGSPDYIPPKERIATFDNDGTLWSEQPAYFQVFYLIDQVKRMAPEHPEWKTREPFASVLKGDMKGVAASGEKGLLEMLAATHSGMTSEQFADNVRQWLATARHPKTGKPFNQMVYQPMLELLNYLRANGFKTFIVSGGGVDFMRVFAEQTYGVPPEQTIGSSLKAKYEMRDGKPAIVKLPDINLIDDKDGKPVGIYQYIGRHPVFAAGNSDGDYQMLEWTTSGDGKRFALLVHHTDEKREWAYDRDSTFGRLDKALDNAKKNGWLIVDMKNDWKVIHPQQ